MQKQQRIYIDGYGMHYDDGVKNHCFATTNKNVQLHTDPHYTDSRFDEEQTVFGSKQPGLSYDYSDRLYQWDYKKAEAASEVANASGAARRTCLWYEAYLSAYYDTPIEIFHIIAGVNRSNGYSYCAYGYKKVDKK